MGSHGRRPRKDRQDHYDRKKAYQPQKELTYEEWCYAVYARLLDVLKQKSLQHPELAVKYAHALIFGDGQPPEDLAPLDFQAVSVYFTMTLYYMYVPSNIEFPGTQEDWFEDLWERVTP
jgi:hypothetical protein